MCRFRTLGPRTHSRVMGAVSMKRPALLASSMRRRSPIDSSRSAYETTLAQTVRRLRRLLTTDWRVEKGSSAHRAAQCGGHEDVAQVAAQRA